MSPHRDFDAARAERAREADPVSFTLGGERFTCVVEPTLADTFALMDAPEPVDNESAAVHAILRFAGNLVVPADRARWAKMVKAQKRGKTRTPVSPADIIELGVWLASEFTGRPSRPSSDLSAGRASTGPISNSGTSTVPEDRSPLSG